MERQQEDPGGPAQPPELGKVRSFGYASSVTLEVDQGRKDFFHLLIDASQATTVRRTKDIAERTRVFSASEGRCHWRLEEARLLLLVMSPVARF